MNKVIWRILYILANIIIVFGLLAPYLWSFHYDQLSGLGFEPIVAKRITDGIVVIGILLVVFDIWHLFSYAARTYVYINLIKLKDVKSKNGII